MKHHNARPPVKVRKHEQRKHCSYRQRARTWRWFVYHNRHPEPDGA